MSIGDGNPYAAGIGLGMGLAPIVPNSPAGALSAISGTPDMWAHIDREQIMRDMMQATQVDIAAAQQASHLPPNVWKPTMPPPVTPPATPGTLAARARELFLKRMGGIKAEMKVSAEDFLYCHVYNDIVHVFYCFGGRNGVTTEAIDLFPSDQLITQFRLVLT